VTTAQILDTVREDLLRDVRVLVPASIDGHSDHELVRDGDPPSPPRDATSSGEMPYATEFGLPD